jgi:hypothetical protein
MATLEGASMARSPSSYLVVLLVVGLSLLGCQQPTSSTPSVPVPAPPQGLSVQAADGAVTVAWTPVQGITTYRLYWAVAGAAVGPGKSTLVELPAIAAIGTSIDGFKNGTTYDFVLTAVNAGGESPASAKVSATPVLAVSAPDAPVGLSLTPVNGAVKVTWTTAVGISKYRLYWSVAGSSLGPGNSTPRELASTDATGTTIDGLTNGTTYDFVLTAVNAGGESAVSTKVSATPLASVVDFVAVTQANLAGTWTTTTSGHYTTTSNGTVTDSGTVTTVITLVVQSNGSVLRRHASHSVSDQGVTVPDWYSDYKGTASLDNDALVLSFTQSRSQSTPFSDDTSSWASSTKTETSTVAMVGSSLHTMLYKAEGTTTGLVGTWVQEFSQSDSPLPYCKARMTLTADKLTVDGFQVAQLPFPTTPTFSYTYDYSATGTTITLVGDGKTASASFVLLGSRYFDLGGVTYLKN